MPEVASDLSDKIARMATEIIDSTFSDRYRARAKKIRQLAAELRSIAEKEMRGDSKILTPARSRRYY